MSGDDSQGDVDLMTADLPTIELFCLSYVFCFLLVASSPFFLHSPLLMLVLYCIAVLS